MVAIKKIVKYRLFPKASWIRIGQDDNDKLFLNFFSQFVIAEELLLSSLLPSSLPMLLALFSGLLPLLFLLVIAYPWPFVIVSLLAEEGDVNDDGDGCVDKNVVMMEANVLFSLSILRYNGLDNISSLIRPIAADAIAAKITM